MLFRLDSFERISTARVTALNRAAQEDVVSCPSDLTANSWRRWFSTLALFLNFSAIDKLALSDWTNKALARLAMEAASSMPLRYAGLKALPSKSAKLRIEEVTFRLQEEGHSN